jgi:hypothetical protein
MTAQLTTPKSNDSRTEDGATTETEPFPYNREETGLALALPVARSRGVLRSRDAAGAVGSAGSMNCPACGAETINGAGLFACTDCTWNGSLR